MEWFIKIPNAILQDKELNHTEMILYGYIASLSTKKWYCFATNWALWEMIDRDKYRTSKLLSHLQARWHIEITEWQLRKIKPIAKNDKGVVKNDKGDSQKWQTDIDKEIDNKEIEIDKEFENFWKLFPHARKWKKQDAKKFYTQINDPTTVIKEVKHLKLKIQAWVEEWKYVPACERWIRDFTPISDEVKVKDLERIMKRHLTTEWAKERYSDLVEVYGEERVKAMAKKISQTLDFNKPKDVQI